jgi:predicted amidohydrolase
MLYNNYKAGFVQIDVKLGDISANLAAVSEQIHLLARQKTDVVVLPEMWSCGFDNKNLKIHAQKTPEMLQTLSSLARRCRMVIAGSMPEFSGDKIFNTLYVFDRDGSVAGFYRKIHLFSVTDEEKYFAAGNRAVVCNTSLGPVGLMICYDLRFPELCRALTLKGAPVVIVSAQWPKIRIRRWDILVQARAIENQIYMIACNRCGTENATRFGGHSLIVDPAGEILEMTGEEPCVRYAEMDFAHMARIRKAMPSLNERAPHAYEI